jgi:hypothetical protein
MQPCKIGIGIISTSVHKRRSDVCRTERLKKQAAESNSQAREVKRVVFSLSCIS